MSKLKLKVCGMSDPLNIQGLVDLSPDFIGFIFYEKSPRFNPRLEQALISSIPNRIKTVGVFVDESFHSILKIVRRFGLDYVQLHGDEDLEFSKKIKESGVKIIKVFRVSDSLPSDVSQYEGIADYLLFDTATVDYGGSGKQFEWDILKQYDLEIPFLLSGGIDISDIGKIKSMNLPRMVGIDVNSRFELEPGLKDLKQVKELKAIL